MKKWKIIAYAECKQNYCLPRCEKIVYARSHNEAEALAWREFPEYHEIGVFEIKEDGR